MYRREVNLFATVVGQRLHRPAPVAASRLAGWSRKGWPDRQKRSADEHDREADCQREPAAGRGPGSARCWLQSETRHFRVGARKPAVRTATSLTSLICRRYARSRNRSRPPCRLRGSCRSRCSTPDPLQFDNHTCRVRTSWFLPPRDRHILRFPGKCDANWR